MDDCIETEVRGAIGIIRMCRPPVNALGQRLRRAVAEAHRSLDADPAIGVILLTGHGRFFSAGADIKEFDTGREPPFLTELIARLERGQTPVVALVNGVAYGGGLELALGCDHIWLLPGASLAFPEIKLGNIPGAGGTQKLPRLVGGPAALEMILSGKPVAADRALDLGLASCIVRDEDEAIDRLTARTGDLPRRRIRDLPGPDTPDGLDAVAAPYLRRGRGAPAARKALEAVRKSHDTPIEDALGWERATFQELNASAEARALRHIFLAEREARHVSDLPPDTPQRPVATAGVIGAGTMGVGISVCLADAGIAVTLVEQDAAALDRGLAAIRRIREEAVAKGRLSPADAAERSGRITGSVDIADLGAADLVVEAVFEAMDTKRAVFARLDRVCKPGAILATNTSTLDVDRIAAATARPRDVIGLHFFSPAHVMKLIEVVRARHTSREVIATCMALAQRLGKLPVLVGVCDGFAGNRAFIDFNREAQILVEEGALPWQVDRVLTDWGFAMGPFAVMDLVGLDVGYRIRQSRGPQHPYPFTAADRLADAGRLGRKAGRGWYRHSEGARHGDPDPEVEALIAQVSREKGIVRRAVPDEEILHRCLWQLVNTGYRIIEEGIVQRPGDLDVIFVNGYGFPRSRGGPIFHADEVGLDRVAADILRYRDRIGQHWEPPALLLRLAGR